MSAADAAAKVVASFGELLPSGNLVRALTAMVQRLDRVDTELLRVDKELKTKAEKEALEALEAKHEQLSARHQVLEDEHKAFVVRFESEMQAVRKQLQENKEQMERQAKEIAKCLAQVAEVREEMTKACTRIDSLEAEMPRKADKEEVDAAIAELRQKIEDMNIEEVIEMAKRANERVDLMDERCDKVEDSIHDLREHVLKKEKEMEDLQLEKQIQNLKEELEAAKTGVFMQATKRMDSMQEETDELRRMVTDTSGQCQINRENIVEIEELVRQSGGRIKSSGTNSTRALIERLQQDVAALQEKYSRALEKEANDTGRHEETTQVLSELHLKLEQLQRAKADRQAVEIALGVKADKEAVARDVEANQRAVDQALSTMNAGTQGIQQMLEQQEGLVSQMSAELQNKPSREELMALQEQLTKSGATPEQQQAVFGRYGLTPSEAAGMMKPLQKFNCISCNRPLQVESQHPAPALPLLSAVKDPTKQHPHVANGSGARLQRTKSAQLQSLKSQSGDSIVEVTDLSSMRSAGGAHTSPRKLQQMRSGSRSTSRDRMSPEKLGKLVGEDGRLYQSRSSPRTPR